MVGIKLVCVAKETPHNIVAGERCVLCRCRLRIFQTAAAEKRLRVILLRRYIYTSRLRILGFRTASFGGHGDTVRRPVMAPPPHGVPTGTKDHDVSADVIRLVKKSLFYRAIGLVCCSVLFLKVNAGPSVEALPCQANRQRSLHAPDGMETLK